ncbi:MAG: hypothetical protein ABW201_05020 [Candidatus Thiodiazotropha sp.]
MTGSFATSALLRTLPGDAPNTRLNSRQKAVAVTITGVATTATAADK